MPRGVDQGPAEGAVAKKCPVLSPFGLRENVAAPLRAAHVISWLRRWLLGNPPPFVDMGAEPPMSAWVKGRDCFRLME